MMERREILQWLLETRKTALSDLWRRADAVRRKYVGDEVHLRGLLEISNHCRSLCAYCGINSKNQSLKRYRMSEDEVVESAHVAAQLGYGTVVLQSGYDPGLTEESVGRIVSRIKRETHLAVTLSLGERSVEELDYWRQEGADRYLLRFETSDAKLFRRIHPKLTPPLPNRFELLKTLDRLGYEVGSGVMVGIPGQTHETLTQDLLLFRELDLDMIGVGPFIPHPHTPLGRPSSKKGLCRKAFKNLEKFGHAAKQVPNTVEMTFKVLALTRLLCPKTNLPTTTAVSTLDTESGRKQGLTKGGNVIMPNVTPPQYRRLYEIYPHKASSLETVEETYATIKGCLQALGRKVDKGQGKSRHWLHKTKHPRKAQVVP